MGEQSRRIRSVKCTAIRVNPDTNEKKIGGPGASAYPSHPTTFINEDEWAGPNKRAGERGDQKLLEGVRNHESGRALTRKQVRKMVFRKTSFEYKNEKRL